MNNSYQRPCRTCGKSIQFRQTSSGKWVALDASGKTHSCQKPEKRKQPVRRSVKTDLFEDIAFPDEFTLKGETNQKRKPRQRASAPSDPLKKRAVKRRSPSRSKNSSLSAQPHLAMIRKAPLLILFFAVLLILLSFLIRSGA